MKITLNREDIVNQYPPFNVTNTKEVVDLFAKEQIHLYVHLPFCKKKCAYCYYKSFDTFSNEMVEDYLAALKREIDTYSQMPVVQSKRIKSLYFGGGTPTLLSCQQLEELAKYIFEKFDFIDDFEFCVEANPDEQYLSPEKLHLLKQMNVKRISFGVQNFNNEILRLNGREVTAETFYRVYDRARKARFEIINIDIMSGMIGETWENWRNIISRLIQLDPESVAFYKMKLYYNTKLFKKIKKGEQAGNLMSNSEEMAMIGYAYDRLQDECGYAASNCFSLVRDIAFEHVHAKGILQGEDMLGCGLAAHSCFNKFLYQNTWDMKEYLQVAKRGRIPVKRAHSISAKEEISSAMVYGIRGLSIDRKHFIDRFGVDMMLPYSSIINELVKEGLLILDDKALRVPRKYYIFADDICRRFFLPGYETMMLAHLSRG